MNWKTKLVLLFAQWRKPIAAQPDVDIAHIRQKANTAAKLGTLLFDKKVSIKHVQETTARHIPLRIYKDAEKNDQRVIIYYHGGGFALYGLDSHDNVCRRICKETHAMVVSVDYRLAPEYTFPCAHQDAFEALIWVKHNIERMGGNPEDIVVAGDSAGGNLAACMAHKCLKEHIRLKAQVLIYPWIDGKLNNPSIHRNGKGYMLEKESLFWFQQLYTPRPEDRCKPEVSPSYESDFTGLPPAFIITAEYDPLLDDGFHYYQQLKEAKVRVKYKEYKELFHGFINLPLVHPNALLCYREIAKFLSDIK